MVKGVCYSHIGKRPVQEDNFLMNGLYLTAEKQIKMEDQKVFCNEAEVGTGIHIFAISDGMGGHQSGEIASMRCVEMLAAFEKMLPDILTLQEGVEWCQKEIAKINMVVCELGRGRGILKAMGATLVLLIVRGAECAVLNIGDSRAYCFDGKELIQITKDNTEGQRMLDLGLLTRKELQHFPARNNLSRYIGYGQNGFIMTADEYYLNLHNDTILLCSDGVSDSLSDKKIEAILRQETNLLSAGKVLIEQAVASEYADNATVILITRYH